jgi:hypothetical protein
MDTVHAELRLAALRTSLERRHDHVTRIKADSALARILVGRRGVAWAYMSLSQEQLDQIRDRLLISGRLRQRSKRHAPDLC